MSKRAKKPQTEVKKTHKGTVKVKGFFNSSSKHPIKLEITAEPKEWEAFRFYTIQSSYMLDKQEQFFREFIDVVENAVKASKKQSRGKHKQRQEFVETVKNHASTLYPFLKYWCKQPLEQWPQLFQSVVERAKKEDNEIFFKQDDKYDPKILTAYCIDKVYGKEAQRLGLKSFFEFDERESVENFYFTYIQWSKDAHKIEKFLIEGHSTEDIARTLFILPAGEVAMLGPFYDSYPLKDFFEALIKAV
jgi:hypothetical protein